MIAKLLLLAFVANVALANKTLVTDLQCGDNEYVHQCGGCDGTCKEPEVACAEICAPEACRCIEGYVRGEDGKCVEKSKCPAVRTRRAANVTCDENESYRQCASCEASCDNLNPMCVKMCQPARCQCLRQYVRLPNGKCGPKQECPAAKEKRDAPQQCPANEQYNECAGCEATCENQSPICTLQCRPPKCQCVQGHVRHSNGSCVPTDSCPKVPIDGGSPAAGVPGEPIVPINDPCATVRCANGPCVAKNGRAVCTGNAETEALTDPCAVVRCANGPCVVKNGRAVCTGNVETGANVDPCSTITCKPEEKCEWVQIQCFVPPCPQDPPKCVPIEKKESE
ncbi:hypothetical protein AAVH_27035 [Aphelenchoides avenae]|nr:hypothetical protein AAVH_27035 [Aphelenchus avenae]